MSKKNIKGDKKKNNRKNYKIESLEPRLLMDAAPNANDWIKEANAANMNFGEYSISAGSMEMENILIHDSSKTDDEPTSLILTEVTGGSKINFKSEVKAVRDFVKGRVEYLRAKHVEPFKQDWENKKDTYQQLKNSYEHATVIERQARPNWLQEIQEADQERLDAENLYYAEYNGFSVDADTLILELINPTEQNPQKPKPAGCSFSLDTSDLQKHKIKVTIEKLDKPDVPSGKSIAPNIVDDTQIVVNFKDFKKDNSSRKTVVEFFLDADDKTGPADSAGLDVQFDFFQQVSLQNKSANIGILDLESKQDSNENDPDVRVIGSYRVDSNGTRSFESDVKYDLDFNVYNSSLFGAGTKFAADSLDHLKYVGSKQQGTTRWQDASNKATYDENAFIPNFANVQIGDIVKQFNAVSKWLQNAESTILNNDFKEMIDQNASSFLNLTEYFRSFVKTPPQSLQELLGRLKDKSGQNVITPSFVYDASSNAYVCRLIHIAEYASKSAKATLSESFVHQISETIEDITKVTLNLTQHSKLEVWFDIPMGALENVVATDSLKDIGIDKDNAGGLIGTRPVCVADNLIAKATTVGENVTFTLYDNNVAKGQGVVLAATQLNDSGLQNICGLMSLICGGASFNSIANYDESNNIKNFAFVTDDSTEKLSIGFDTDNSRRMGFNGAQQFCKAYLIPVSSSLDKIKVFGHEIEKGKTSEFDWAAAINEFLMSKSNYADYSAISFKNYVAIVYNSETQASATMWNDCDNGEAKRILLSSTMPIVSPTAGATFTFTVGGVTSSIAITKDEFSTCCTIEDVVGVVNGKLSEANNDMKAFVWDGKIGFYNKNNLSFTVSQSSTNLGFNKTSYASTTNCIRFKLDDGSVFDIDLCNYFTDPTKDKTIEVLLDAIKVQCNSQLTALSSSCSFATDGLKLKVSGGKILSVENINGFSLVDLLGWNVENDFDTYRIVRAQKQKDVKISKLDLYVNERLSTNVANGTVASGRLGPVGVDVKGSIDITATSKISLTTDVSDISKITDDNYCTYFKCYDNPDSTDSSEPKNFIGTNGIDWTYTSNGTGTNVLTVKHKTGLENGAQSTVCKVNLCYVDDSGKTAIGTLVSDKNLLSEEVRLFKKDALTNVSLTSMSGIVDNVAAALKEGVLKNLLKYGDLTKDELDAMPKDSVLDVLNKELPLFGKSAPELLGLINKLNDVIGNITKDHPATLQELNQRIYKALGANLYFEIKNDSIDFSLVWYNEYSSQRVGINDFAILESVNIGGAAEVYLNGHIDARFDFTMSTDGNALGSPELKEGAYVEIDVSLVGKPLSFDLTLNAGGKTPPLMKVVSSDANPSYIRIEIKENISYEKSTANVTSGEEDSDSEEPKVIWKLNEDACKIGGKLRIECAGLDVGEIKLGVVGQTYTKEDPTLHVINSWNGSSGSGSFKMADVVNGKIGVRIPKELIGEVDIGEYNTVGSVVLDFSGINTNWEKFDLFGQVRLVADALSTALRKAQSSLNKTFLSDGMRKIPLVGDSIVGAADCLTALDENFIEPFRKFAYNSQNLDAAMVAERLYTILQKTGLLLALDKEVLFDAQNNCTQKVAWAGSLFDQVFSDNGSQFIQYKEDGNGVEWRFRLGDVYTLSGNADFDLGMPGLGLSSKGGVGLEMGWEWYIGFGISQTGAYIMLSNGSDEDGSETVNGKTVNIVADGISKKVETDVGGTTVEQDLMSGDDIRIQMTLRSKIDIDGSMGFLALSGDLVDDKGNALTTDSDGRSELATFTFGIDLNDGQNGSDTAERDRTTDDEAVTKIKTDNIASALSLETNFEGNLDINVNIELGFDTDKIDIGFPKIGTIFHLSWAAVFGKSFGELKKARFDDISLNLGDFVERTLKPILGKIQKVIEPIMPLIDFLQSEIPVLSSLPKGGSKMTVLNLIKSIGDAKGVNLGMIDDIVKVANLVKTIGSFDPGEIKLGSLNLFSGLDTDEDVSSFLSGTSGLPLGDFAGRISGGDSTAASAAANSFSSKFGSPSTSNGKEYGWFFPIFTNDNSSVLKSLCNSTLQLMFGQDVSLVEYRMSPLIFDFDWSKSFPIVGPLCADIGLNFGAQIELCFGYDTHGLISWKKTGFKDLWALADGFYIDDLDSHGKDVSEVIFYSGITAGASVAGRAGINVGVNLNLNLNFDDPNNDGKLRLSELADSLAHSPFAIFDASVTLQARAYAYLDLFFYRKEFDLWKSGALELFNTDKTGTGKPVIATTQEGNLVVNVGTFAEKRVYGDLSDGDDTVEITCSGNSVTVKIVGIGDATYKLDSGKTVYVYANEGNDHIKVKSENNAADSSLNFVIEGGNGNDEIDLSGLRLKEGCYALVMGGLGDDFIHGANVGVNILLGETADVLYKTRKVGDDEFEYVAMVNAYPNSSNSGNNVIVGGSGKNYIVGGGGSDLIVGGVDATIDVKAPNGTDTDKKNVTENHLYGDFAYFEFDESHNLTNAKNEDLYDEGGNDVILGSSKTDFIFGGAGSDRIKGGDGDDEIHGGKGNDVIYGGAGNDKIYGEDGVDVIFGDTPANEAMVIAREDDAVGELPYVYIAEEIKKDTSDLFGSDTVTTTDADGNVSSESVNRIALFNFENSFKTDVASLNALAQVAVTLFDAPQIDLSATQTAATTGATATGTATPTTPTVLPVNGDDEIYGGNDSDIIFGDDGKNDTVGGSDKISGGAGNDFIDGDDGNDTINGDYGEDIIYGGAGNDTLDGGAGNDFVFGDNGLADYQKNNAGKIAGSSSLYGETNDENQDPLFGYGIAAFKKNFEIPADAKSSNTAGNDTILAGNGSDFVDGQGGDDSYKIQIMGGSNHAITNVMDSGTADKGDSMTINGTIVADDMLVRASEAGLGFVAKLPSQEDAQIERVNFWNVGGGDTGLENIALNTGAGDDKIAIDGTLSTITIDAGAGDDTVTVGQLFESERTTDKDHSNVKTNDVFKTIKTSQGYLSEGVKHSTSIVGGEGNDTFNVLHNEAAVSLSGGLGNDTFNVAMFQKVNNDGSKSIVENGPVTLIGGAGVDKMSIVGSDGDDDFVISQGRVLSNGIDVQAVSIENKNVYGGDGDDSFYVLDTAKDEVTKLYGNKGNDSFYNGGIGTAEKPVIVSNSKNSNPDAIGVQFDVPKNNTVGDADPANGVIDYDTDLDCAKNYIVENGVVKSVYKIHLDKEPEKGEVVSVTVFAPGETTESLNRGDHGIWLVDANNKYVKSITYKFTIDGTGETHKYDEAVDINLVVLGDKVREGNDYFALMHKVTSSKSDRLIKDCKNALIFLNENAAQQSFLIKQVHEVKDAEFTAEKFTLLLNETPNGNTVECFYYANGQKIPLGSANVVENNGKFQVTVDVPASVKTAMDAAKTPHVYVEYNIDRPVNKVENQFSITQEHVLTAEEIANGKFTWPMQAIPERAAIDCWYMSGDKYVTIPTTALGEYNDGVTTYPNILTVSGVSSIPAGTKLYINYRFDHVYVENESVLQMAYSTTGMTELLCFVPKDEITGAYDNSRYSIVCPESKVADYKDVENCRYFYRTAGTQLIICAMPQDGVDTSSAKPVVLHGNFAIEWSGNNEWHRPAVAISDEPDSFNETSVTEILDALDDDTIENIKGALYEDGMGREADLGIDGPSMLHYDGLDADGNRLTTSNDEKNVISESDLAERKAAEEEAAKFDEGNSKDRIFVNNRKNNRAGIKNDIDALSEIAKFDDSMIEKDVDPALILQKTEDVVKQADTEWHDSDEHSVRFTHKDAGATGNNELTLSNMEYAEINLGTGEDQVDVHKTVYREDGFQTFTVLNTGTEIEKSGSDNNAENTQTGDNIVVHSYAEEHIVKIGELTGLTQVAYSGSLKNVAKYNVTGFTFCEGFSIETLTDIVADNASNQVKGLLDRDRVFLNVEYTDGTVQRREVVLDELEGDAVTSLVIKRTLTPVAAGVTIKSAYIENGNTGDGLLVVNAQGGDDTINAVGDVDAEGKSKVTREGMVVIGGVGDDTIDVNTNVIAIGDRGQIVYENEKNEIVTRLGSLDIENSETDDAKLNAADYTTPADKTASNYFQTDGVVRDAKYIHSVSETVGGNDVITAHGDKNVAIGGAGSDEIYLNGENNVAVGDNGEVKFAGSDVVKNASGDVVDHVYGDSSMTYLNYVQSTSDSHGAIDTITTQNGKNVVIGGTDSDMIATGSGNDVIVGDGGEVYVDRNRDALLVDNVGRNVDGSAGSDVIKTSGGDNVILGGLNTKSRDFDFVRNAESGKLDKMSIDKNNDDLIESGDGKDVVFGDNAYVTFKGNSEMAKGFDNMPTIYTEATLSFNFQGSAQFGIGANEQAGVVADYTVKEKDDQTKKTVEHVEHVDLYVKNWNNIKGHESGTYGDNDSEVVLFDNGTRASAVSVTYGASEDHRVNTTDGDNIRLHGYNQEGKISAKNSGDYNLMKSGLDTTGNNARNTLLAQVDGLDQYFTDYDVIVYLDMVQENSWAQNSVRVVSLYRDVVENGVASSELVMSYYVNDPESNSFNGNWVVGRATSAKEAREAVDNYGNRIYANCVIFEGITGDRFHVEITDGDGSNGYNNGKDRAGIAGIQVHGRLHGQDVAASTDIANGGNDVINTRGGDDIVVGGTGNDSIKTFGDDRYGIYDNDVVYGDNAKMVFTDRDSDPDTASTISYAESIVSTNMSASYNDSIMTGDGNDVVVGGSGSDTIDAGATAQADEKLAGLEVFSLNFTDVSTNQSTLISKGEAAGVVVDNDWHNAYLYNTNPQVHGESTDALENVRFQYDCYGNTSAPTEVTNASMDADTSNNKMMMNYVGGHNQDPLTVRLWNIPTKFTQNKYDVYVYIDGINNDSDAHGYVFKIHGSNGIDYYLNDWSGNRFDGDFKEVTCTSYTRDMFKDGVTPSVEMIGNYVVFHDVETSTFDVTIECVETTYGTQKRNDLPVISAVQLVASKNPDIKLEDLDIAVGGDHDKDFVMGDDAKLHFDLDIPFAGDESIGDYQNRLISAESAPVSGSASSDKIWTGKDRDVVIGGEGDDRIDAGAGDDVVIGNTVGKLYVEHNNPLGVFRPDVNIVLEDNDYNVAEPRPYLDGQGGNRDQIRSMVQNGQVKGITLDSNNTANDIVYGGYDNKDLVFNGNVSWENLEKELTSDQFYGVQDDGVHAKPTSPAHAEEEPGDNEESANGNEEPVNGGEEPSDVGGEGSDTPSDVGGEGSDTPSDVGGEGSDTPSDVGGEGSDTPSDVGGEGSDTPSDVGGEGSDTPSDVGGEGSEGEGSESGEDSEQNVAATFVLGQKHVPVYVEIAAGETVEIVITDWEEGNPYYRPKVVLEMNSLDNMMHYLDISWDGISQAITRDLLNYNWLEIPNSSTVPGEHKIVLQIHSDEAIAFLASCGNR